MTRRSVRFGLGLSSVLTMGDDVGDLDVSRTSTFGVRILILSSASSSTTEGDIHHQPIIIAHASSVSVWLSSAVS
ncbi:hypothetical protein T190_30980 [Sinorhizobium meliloti CCBAU 01290]|nr:hypothetical protein T190_30980 [Sinorhizobium meliloti CCBAU 01290]